MILLFWMRLPNKAYCSIFIILSRRIVVTGRMAILSYNMGLGPKLN